MVWPIAMMAKPSTSNRFSTSRHVAPGPWQGMRFAVLFAVGVITPGCGPGEPVARMSGTVTYQSEPVAEGLIVLSNPRQGVYITASIVDGAYEVKTSKHGVPPGDYHVAITPPLVDHPVGPILERPKPAAYANIPPRYRDEGTSGFTAQLEDGNNVVDFDMTK